MSDTPAEIRPLFRIELKVGKGDSEAVVAIYATGMAPDAACPGNIIFVPENPMRYKYAGDLVFVATKTSVSSSEIVSWQEGFVLSKPPEAE